MKTLNILASTMVLSFLFYSCDKNEFAPVIVEQDFIVAENTPAGGTFGTVLATDADAGQRLSYEIVDGNLEGVFDIDGSSGSLLVNDANKLDYESTRHYILRVVVSDNHKNDPLESSANIFIDVTDANEYAPIIPDIENQVFSISENSMVGTIVGIVEASDEDSEQTLTYSIKSGNESSLFAINSENGIITIVDNSTLDYEITTQYLLTVAVSDDHKEDPLESTASMQVDVLDVNEFSPQIESRTFTLDENPSNGQEIGLINASDGDTRQSLTFTIIGQNEKNYFQINAQTGSLTVLDNTGFDYETTQEMNIIVKVEDDHLNSKTDTALINVKINNVYEITDYVLAHYSFNGNADDISGNMLHGVVYGPQLSTGKDNETDGAYLFDGTDDYIQLPEEVALNSDSSFSIEVWVNKDCYTSDGKYTTDGIFGQSDGGSGSDSPHIAMYMYPDKTLRGVMRGTASPLVDLHPSDVLEDNQWHHIVMTRNVAENSLALFVNGDLISESNEILQGNTTSNDFVSIGGIFDDLIGMYHFFCGKIDMLRLFSIALTQEEIAQLSSK